MGALLRGFKNAVRSPGRTLAVTVMLGLSLGLALTMAVAKQAVDQRVDTAGAELDNVLSQLATTLVVRPAGTGGFGGAFGGGAGGQQATLAEANVTALAQIDHVVQVVKSLSINIPSNQTTLRSALTFGGPGGGPGGQGGFTPPLMATGATDLSAVSTTGGAGSLAVVSGSLPDLSGATRVAVLGSELAAHNGLTIGSTFDLYGQAVTVTATVSGTANRFANNTLVLPLAALQNLAGRTNEISTATLRIDAAANLDGVQAQSQALLGDEADIVNQQDQVAQSNALQSAQSTLASLDGVSGLALTSLLGALGASVVIVFLTMTMVVRERRKEIGVLKAIGAPTPKVVWQFAAEAIALTAFALSLAVALALLFSNGVTQALVASNTQDPAGGIGAPGPTGPGGGAFSVALNDIEGALSPLLLGLAAAAAFLVAVLGCAVPVLATARVRPSEVLRGD